MDKIRRNMEVYIDDIILKYRNIRGLLEDLRERFGKIRWVGMRLNPKKCVFGFFCQEMFRFHCLSAWNSVDPEKIRVMQHMPPPRSVQDVQCLSRYMAYLSYFLGKMGEKSLPFYQLPREMWIMNR